MKYIKKTLENGMTVVLAPMECINVIAIGFFVRVGSRDEDKGKNGVAHFLEHMMFKINSTKTSNDIFKELDSIGAIYNAGTTSQLTYYYFYGNSNNTKQLLDTMFDIYTNTQFDSREIDIERKIIIEEMTTRRYDSPFTKLNSKLHEKIFRGTSLSESVIGTLDTINSIKKKDLINFKSKHYDPSNTVFVVAGNFNPIAIFNIINRVLGGLPTISENKSDIISNLNQKEKEIICENMRQQEKPYVYAKKSLSNKKIYITLAFPIYDLYSTKNREIDLLSLILSAGFSSRLAGTLREEYGITYVIKTDKIIYADSGVFTIQTIFNEKSFQKGLHIILDELRKIKDVRISDEELEKAINIYENDKIYSLIRPLDVLRYLGSGYSLNKSFRPDIVEKVDDLKKVSGDDIKKVAQTIFIREKINLFIYGNIKEKNYNFSSL